MNFIARWKHSEGSLVEFSETGWRSSDPEKNDWLIKMSTPGSTTPAVPPVIRMWLKENCELIELEGSRGLLDSEKLSPQRLSDIKHLLGAGVGVSKNGRRTSSRRYLQLTKRKLPISMSTLEPVWENFFRIRRTPRRKRSV